ncbi:PKD domain-containing protein [Candidatus Bathyarchaeota archaeon]|nr:MAG: PKD domain-containing protein [Candidatus Bathyarchaeota archaeon]
MKTEIKRRIRIIRLVLLIAVLVASQTISFETSGKLQTVNATLSSSAPFQYIVTILMENSGLCDVTPCLAAGCGSSSIQAPYLTTLAQTYGFNTHYTGIGHPSEPNYVALFGGSTLGISSDGNCCFQLNAPNLVDRLEAAGLTWKAFAEDASGSGTCNFMPPREGDHFPFIDFSDMKTSARCANMLTTTSPLDPEFVGALNGATLPNYVWLTPNDTDNMHSSSVAVGDAYLAALVPLILSSRMFTTQNAALFIVFDEGNDFCPTGNSSSDCVVAAWAGPAVKKAYSSSTSYNHYSYLSTLEASWNLPSLTSNDASATPMTEFFGTSPPPTLSASFTYSPSSPQIGQAVSFTSSASGGSTPYTYSWSFGDGSTGTGSSPNHTYSSAGTLTVALTVKDNGSPQQTKTSQQSITVSGAPPPLTASFAFSPSSTQAGQHVTFTASAGGGTSPFTFSWSFGDGSTGTGSPATHTYSSAGSYTVILTVKDSSSSPQTAASQITFAVTSPPPPISASFTLSPSLPSAGQSVSFTAYASGGTSPYSYLWSYGDGSSGTGLQVTHTYNSDGTYQVTLTVADSQGNTSTGVESVVVGKSSLQDGFTYSPISPQPSDNINFTGSARGGAPPYTYSWDFGNGASASGASATYSYATAGSYMVTLTVIDSTSHSNNTSQSLTIYSPAQPDFRLNTDQSTLNVQPGTVQSLAIIVTDNAGPSGTIRFDATISPSGPRISLDPANITLASEGSGSTNLNIDIVSTTPPGPYWIQVNATNGSITHSITVQMDVAQHSQVPTTSPPCLLCLGVAAVITILGIAGEVTLVTVGARRRQRFAGVRVGNVEEVGPNRARQRLGRPLQ